jgi:hypothetical protein
MLHCGIEGDFGDRATVGAMTMMTLAKNLVVPVLLAVWAAAPAVAVIPADTVTPLVAQTSAPATPAPTTPVRPGLSTSAEDAGLLAVGIGLVVLLTRRRPPVVSA